MKLIIVDTPRLADLWVRMPGRIYAGDANYIPHLRQDIEKVFDPVRNKMYRDGDAKRWLAVNDEADPHNPSMQHILGRIAAFHMKKYSSGFAQPTGGIGFFECVNDTEMAHKLFDAAFEWLQSLGMKAVDGPINFGEKDAYWGCVVDNFTDMHSYRMNFNPPYYPVLLESYGFQVYYEQWCYKRHMHIPAQEIFNRKIAMLGDSDGIRVCNVRGYSDERIASDFLTVYNSAWGGHAGFKTMQMQQARNIVKAMKPVLDRDIAMFAYHFDRPIGFYINLPELNEIFQHMHGNFNLWGKLKFLWYQRFGKRHTMVGVIFGIDREYHGRGIEAAMIKYAEQHVVPLNRYKETIMTWIGDFNPKMIRVVENLGASRYRTLVTYRKYVDPTVPFERCPTIQ